MWTSPSGNLCIPPEQVTERFMGVDLTNSERATVTIKAKDIASHISTFKTIGNGTFGGAITHNLILHIYDRDNYHKSHIEHLMNFSLGEGRFQKENIVSKRISDVVQTYEHFPNGELNNDFWWVTTVMPGSSVATEKFNEWFFGSCFLANRTCKRITYPGMYAVEFSYSFDNSSVLKEIEGFIQYNINQWAAACKSA